jgi:outer membrane protein
MSLSEALSRAMTHDPTYLAAIKSRDAGVEKKWQGIAGVLPTVAGTYDDGRSYRTKTNKGAWEKNNLDNRSYTITATQPIFDLAAIRAAQQGFQSAAGAEAGFGIARQEAMLRLVSAYFEVLNAQDALATTLAEKKAIGEQLEAAKRSFEVGTATVTDQQEAQARFDLITASEIRARNTLNIRRQALSILTGQPTPEALPGFKAGVSIPSPMPMVADEWVNQARASGFEVRKAFADAERNRMELTKQVFNNLPTVDIVARKTWGKDVPTFSSGINELETEYVGLSITVPILAGGLNISQIREAAATRDEFQHRLQAARLNAEQGAREAYLNVVAGLAQITALEAAEKSSQLALESNRLGYQVGVRINIDVLNAQQQLFAAQRDLSKARTDTLLAGLRLKAAVAALNPDDVDVVSGLILGQTPKKN